MTTTRCVGRRKHLYDDPSADKMKLVRTFSHLPPPTRCSRRTIHWSGYLRCRSGTQRHAHRAICRFQRRPQARVQPHNGFAHAASDVGRATMCGRRRPCASACLNWYSAAGWRPRWKIRPAATSPSTLPDPLGEARVYGRRRVGRGCVAGGRRRSPAGAVADRAISTGLPMFRKSL